MSFQQIESTDNATSEIGNIGKESSVEDNGKHAVDLSDEDPPSVNVAQQSRQIQLRGKRRMTNNSKNKEGSQGSSEPPNASPSDHKLLKTIKQEK